MGGVGFVGKNFYVKAVKSSARTRVDAVDNQFGHIEGASFVTAAGRVDDEIAAASDLCAVFVLLFGFEFIFGLGV